jgi:hypothetical protein
MADCSLTASLDGLTGGQVPPDATAGDAGDAGEAGSDSKTAEEGGETSVVGSDSSNGHGYRVAITVSNTDQTTLPAGYVVSFSLDTASLVAAGKMRANLSDLHVTSTSGGDRDRVVDPGAPSTIWFALSQPIASGSTDAYSLDYGAPGAGTAPADPTKVFAFFDDFSTQQQHWILNGAPVFGSARVTLRQGQVDALTTNAALDNVPAASSLQIVATVGNPASGPGVLDGSAGFYYWLGYQRAGDFATQDPWVLWIARNASEVHGEVEISGTTCASFPSPPSCAGNPTPQDAHSHTYRIDRAPSGTSFWLDGNHVSDVVVPNVDDLSIMLRNFDQNSDVVVTGVRARPLVDREPTVTLGPEQAAP